MSSTNDIDQPNPKRNNNCLVLFFLVAGFVVLLMLLPAVNGPRGAAPAANCQSNMRNIAIAILNYETTHERFPRAVRGGDDGTPPRSWRVEVLPQLEHQPTRDRYKDDLPWDAGTNHEIAKRQLPLFQCPSSGNRNDETDTFKTDYVLITGPRTVFPLDQHTTAADLKDGASSTIMMIEINNSDIAWTEPRDITLEDAIALFNRPASVRKKYPTNHRAGRMVAFADGHVDFVPEDTPPEVLRALFTIDDGKAVSLH